MNAQEAREIVSKLHPDTIADIKQNVLDWHKIFAIIPITTEKGERLWGTCYRKYVPMEEHGGMNPIYLATEKDVFCAKLGA